MAILTKKPEAPKTPQAPEQKTLDLSQVFKKREGKGGCYYIESPDQGITFTIVGTIGKKLASREKAGRPVKDVEEFLLNWFPVELTNQLEKREISLVQAYGFMSTQRGTKVSNYSKKMSHPVMEGTDQLIWLGGDHRAGEDLILPVVVEASHDHHLVRVAIGEEGNLLVEPLQDYQTPFGLEGTSPAWFGSYLFCSGIPGRVGLPLW